MTQPTPAGETPDWAVAGPPTPRPEPSGAYLQLAVGLLLVLVSLVVVGVEAWQILTQPTLSTDGTVVERLGWPLIPGIFGITFLVERWYDQRSTDVR